MEQNFPRYREDVLKKFFHYVKSGESFYIIGAPSVGKTRFMDFLMGDDPDAIRDGVKVDHDRTTKQYLGEEASAQIWLARVDMNRLRVENEWGFRFFELMLSTVLFACNKAKSTDEVEKIKAAIADLYSDVLESKDALKAHRLFEMAVNMICQSYGIRLCFLLDEFDETYQSMPRELFAHLRAIRDANKYRVSYVMFLRNLPEKLRDPVDNEGFYELLARNMLGLGPYSKQDTFQVIEQIGKRLEITLSDGAQDGIYLLSGGHPGFVLALLKVLKENPNSLPATFNIEWYAKQSVIQEEFRKIWIGLLEDERTGFLEFIRGNHPPMSPETGKLLLAKGLLKLSADNNTAIIFSPLFEYWLSKQ